MYYPTYHHYDSPMMGTPMTGKQFLATCAVIATVVAAVIYLAPTDCIEECFYDDFGFGSCRCIEYIYSM
ncbi:MAG: hypothetical protein K940chlam6_01164 [Chlamydiae bacterium]|nr:hypothetical protein [Chlamydiota bacterium]